MARPGDVVHVRAWDHTTNDQEGWHDLETITRVQPVQMDVVGVFLGKTEQFTYISLGRCGEYYTTTFIIVNSAIIQTRVLAKASTLTYYNEKKGANRGRRKIAGVRRTARRGPRRQ